MRTRPIAAALTAVAVAGCGSRAAQPPAAGPGGRTVAQDGRTVAVLRPRARVLETFDARSGRPIAAVPAGIGPSQVVSDGADLVYVTDAVGDALLVFHLRPRLELTRRLALPGGPDGLTIDTARRVMRISFRRSHDVAEVSVRARPGLLRREPSL